MEKEPDFRELAKKLDSLHELKKPLNDIMDFFTLEYEQHLIKGYVEKFPPEIILHDGLKGIDKIKPDITINGLGRTILDGSDKSLNELFLKHWSEYKDECKGDITAFIKYEVEILNRLISRAEKVSTIEKNIYRMTNSYLNFLMKKDDLETETHMSSGKGKSKLRRPVAFCVCLLYKANKFDISTMTKRGLENFIKEHFKDEGTGLPITSAQKVVHTLTGYDLRFKGEKAIIYYRNKCWKFNEENYSDMIDDFDNDHKKALELFEKFK
jgi:hypothetical protein